MCTIALLTIWRRIQEPAFLLLILIGIVLAYLLPGLDSLDTNLFQNFLAEPSDASRNPTGGFHAGILLLLALAVLIAIFCGSTEIPRDMSSKVMLLLLSKPLSRRSYVLGKYLGTTTLSVFYCAVWITVLILCYNFGSTAGELQLDARQYQCLLILLPITAVTTCASCFFSDLTAMITSAMYLFVSFAAEMLPAIASLVPHPIDLIVLAPYYLFPNLCYFLNTYNHTILPISLLGYGIALSIIFLLLGYRQFARADIH